MKERLGKRVTAYFTESEYARLCEVSAAMKISQSRFLQRAALAAMEEQAVFQNIFGGPIKDAMKIMAQSVKEVLERGKKPRKLE